MALVSCLTDAWSMSAYTYYVTELTMLFDSSHLLLSVTKTQNRQQYEQPAKTFIQACDR